ncbi:MAG: nucleotidyltransferase domain-containing protein [Nanoarchaeota archaeon]|nr:nucleotidyltransferase domain-containing protein [Nanoarchaeota archaeon]
MLKIVDVFIHNLLSRVSNIISVCVFGSRQSENAEESSDLDILIIVDDTFDIDKDYTTEIIKKISYMVNPIIHCQIFYLKEFWKYISTGSPITFTILRDSTIYYDTGFFDALQKLVRSGTIKPKTEAVERQLTIAKQLMKITYHSVNKGLIQNLEGAIVSSTQSLLMEMGIEPPAPKEVPLFIKKYLVEREILSDEYYVIARKVIQTYKDIEHNVKPALSGKILQELYNDTNKFVMKVEEILSNITKRKV